MATKLLCDRGLVAAIRELQKPPLHKLQKPPLQGSKEEPLQWLTRRLCLEHERETDEDCSSDESDENSDADSNLSEDWLDGQEIKKQKKRKEDELNADNDWNKVLEWDDGSMLHAHPLKKMDKVYGTGQFICDICNELDKGWVYHCDECGFDAHIQCAFRAVQDYNYDYDDDEDYWPNNEDDENLPMELPAGEGTLEGLDLQIEMPAREHTLKKTDEVYGSGRFYCDICDEPGRGWVYHCDECGFDTHLKHVKRQ